MSRHVGGPPPVSRPIFTDATLPDAAAWAYQLIQVSNVAGVGVGLMWSDGATWRQIPFSAQKVRAQTLADGTLTLTYPIAFPTGYIPRIAVVAEATAGTSDIINAQIDGVPDNLQAKFRVTRSSLTLVGLLGITIAVPVASPGATWLHIEVFG